MLSRNWRPVPLNGAYTSTPLAGHAIIPLTAPLAPAAVRTLDRGPASTGAAVERAREVRDLVLEAVRERGAVADDQRQTPRVRAEDVREPPVGVRGVRGRAGELVDLARHHRQAGAVGGGVLVRPAEAEPERRSPPCAMAPSSASACRRAAAPA